ncbi:large conductance mechanosensitive channel protein MscL [Macrococcus brunensis]|uniref:Large-conductance mechanosensitive channel n=1 Tax=Macrococcus brunensis TaxID=198483 RepID=A0A4R6BAZ3_9STAP|nr:large conductance mechanosensitive channel protein MscL [Macrococcus brunensis]TDL94114.1 large conductance mechanosensitive channel protein MscL [Macrococcus brunensis]ULG70930.1 large conductance mechanosensitive channel protein MscL [Macrococcus brunensis]ULG73266.1 large conductance mechanosensitive channel protein MscL [Macrococcus brunensis]
MSLMKEFKEFAIKGNVLELAVAVVIGAAFGKIVTALVESVIMPIIALVFGGKTDFAKDWAYMGIKYGVFIQSIIDFLIVAFSIFLFVKVFNKLTRAQPKEETIEENTVLLTEIRDLLRNKNL